MGRPFTAAPLYSGGRAGVGGSSTQNPPDAHTRRESPPTPNGDSRTRRYSQTGPRADLRPAAPDSEFRHTPLAPRANLRPAPRRASPPGNRSRQRTRESRAAFGTGNR